MTFVAASITKAPFPTVAQMVAGEMEPGMYSAQEVLAIGSRIATQQEDVRMSAAPPPSPARRAVVI